MARLSGYPSIDKPWLKYYSEEAINMKLPQKTMYEYAWENNKNHPKDIVFSYYRKKTTYEQFFDNVRNAVKRMVLLYMFICIVLPCLHNELHYIDETLL